MRGFNLFALIWSAAVFIASAGAEESAPAPTAKAPKANYKIGGRLGLGSDFESQEPLQELFEVRIGVQTRRKDGVRANVELKAEEGTRDVSIHDAFLDYRTPSKSTRIRAGRGKKILGWEYEYSTAQRLTVHRTALYQQLQERSFVGRDYFVSFDRFLKRPLPEEDEDANGAQRNGNGPGYTDGGWANPLRMIDPEDRLKFGMAFHFDETRNYAFVGNAIATFSPNWQGGLWAIGQRSNTHNGDIRTWGAMLSALFETFPHRAAMEVFWGGDPLRTEIERDYGEGKDVRMGSVRAEYGVYLDSWNPYAAPTIFWNDLENPDERLTQGILGLRYFFIDKLNVAFEYAWSRQRSGDPTTMSYDRQIATVMGRYFF